MARVILLILGLAVALLQPSEACYKETISRLIKCLPNLLLHPPPRRSTLERNVCSTMRYRQGISCVYFAVVKCPKVFRPNFQYTLRKSLIEMGRFCAGKSGCNGAQIVKQCTNMMYTSSQTFLLGMPGGGSGKVINNICRRRSYNYAARCLTYKLKRCRPFMPPTASRIVKPDVIRAAWVQVCSKRALFQRYSACFISKRPQILKCIRNGFRHVTSSNNTTTRPSQLQMICGGLRRIHDCKVNVLKSCGTEAAKVIGQYDNKIRVGICGKDRATSSKPTTMDIIRAAFQL